MIGFTKRPAAAPIERWFAVRCAKAASGRELEFQRYPTEAEASAVARRLTALGCQSRVVKVRRARKAA